MHLGSLLVGMLLGAGLTALVALRGRRRHAPPPRRAVRVAADPAPVRAGEPDPPPAALRLDEVRDDDLLNELLDRNRRLSRDTAERLHRDAGPPARGAARGGETGEPGSELLERVRKLDEDTRRRLSR